MSTLVLTPTKMRHGIWQGFIQQTGTGVPQVSISHLNEEVPDVQLTETGKEAEWLLQVPVPAAAIADGVQVFVISDKIDGTRLGQFKIGRAHV